MILRVTSCLLFALSLPLPTQAAPPRPGAAELLRAIERLAVVGNVLYVAAHPDDENTRLLSYLAGERLLRTAYLSLTRGDGGQNLIGKEQGPLLGLIRTQELLAARQIDGAEQLFTRARDFGYSKTPKETLAIWDKDAVLLDVVRAIRRFRPDVIITRFPTDGVETHGHHTASAILAEEAFRAAADGTFRQELTLSPWQARRLVWNRFSFGPAAKIDAAALKLDIGGYNPLLGVSYGELAADSRSMHKSQGFGAARARGPSIEQFLPRLGDPPRQSIFDGLDLTWGRVPGTARLRQHLAQARRQFDAAHPDAIIPILLQAKDELEGLVDNPWKGPKLQELSEVLGACAGLFLEAIATDFSAPPGGEISLKVTALNRSPAKLELLEVRPPAGSGAALAVRKPLVAHEPLEIERPLPIPKDAPASNPYWLAEPPGPGLYTVRDATLIGLPERPAPAVEFQLRALGRSFVLSRPIVYKWTDPVAGERTRPVEITPAVTITPEVTALMFPDGQPKALTLRLKAAQAGATGALRLTLPAGWRAEPKEAPFELQQKGEEGELRFRLFPPPGPACGSLQAAAELGGARLSRGLVRIEHPHIPIQTLFPEAEVRLCRVNLRRTRTRIGYIQGAGDEVPAALRQVGYEVTLLDDEALAGPLGRYEAVIVGVRAYNTNPRLSFHHKRLMDYVAAGGALVVQYSTSNRLGKLTAPIGPSPFEISQERVTDENAPVSFALPQHPMLKGPNRISSADFEGWVQERGLYFATGFGEMYEAPLSMHDPGEPPRKGALIALRHGKGVFVYTGLSFFRQLPAGIPGAYRLFGNVISYGR